jgi:hypothetical protein
MEQGEPGRILAGVQQNIHELEADLGLKSGFHDSLSGIVARRRTRIGSRSSDQRRQSVFFVVGVCCAATTRFRSTTFRTNCSSYRT